MSHLIKDRSSRSGWLLAWALTLALHALVYLGFRMFPPLSAAPLLAPDEEVMEVVFAEEPATESPPPFTELPPDREDTAPEKADFLSNVTSRARDEVPGGDAALPRMQGSGDAAMVALDPAKPPSPVTPPPTPEKAAKADAQVQAESQGQAPDSAASSTARDVDEVARALEDSLRQMTRTTGGSDIHQPEMDYPGGNATLTGDVSLSTLAWDWAPWLQRFRRKLMSRWYAPTAYYMGLLKEGGWAMVEIEITPSGQIIRRDLLEAQGHISLIRAATSALVSVAPVEPLPKDFPDKTLVLRIRMVYPKYRSR